MPNCKSGNNRTVALTTYKIKSRYANVILKIDGKYLQRIKMCLFPIFSSLSHSGDAARYTLDVHLTSNCASFLKFVVVASSRFNMSIQSRVKDEVKEREAEAIPFEAYPPGVFMQFDFEEEPVFVNLIEDTFPVGSKLQKRLQPTEKACYSHSPPDMKLEATVFLSTSFYKSSLKRL